MQSNAFLYSLPTRIVYGRDTRFQLAERVKELGLKSLLLVTDKGLRETGIVEEMETELQAAGIKYSIFDELSFEPSTGTVEAGVELIKKVQAEGLIGLGGGSPLDTAKAMAVLATSGGQVRDYVGMEKLPRPPLPLIALPTTAGTGSEATRWALITDLEAEEKLAIGCWETMPRYSICDPVLTKTMPPRLTASTGMDALTHAVEALININCQPISEAMALQSIRLIGDNLRRAVARGNNLAARDGMLMGSLTAALAFNVTGITSVHAISHVVGASCGIPHGVANALLLPHVMEYSLMGAPERFALIAEAMGEELTGLTTRERAERSVTAVKGLLEDIGLNQGLERLGFSKSMVSGIAEEALESASNLLHPREMDLKTVTAIINRARKGIEAD